MKMKKYLSVAFIALSLMFVATSCENDDKEKDQSANNTLIAADIVSELSSGLINQEPMKDETNRTVTQPIVGKNKYVTGNMIYNFDESNILESVSCEMTVDCKSTIVATLVSEMLKSNSSFSEKFPAENILIEGSSIKLSYTQTNDLLDKEIKGMTIEEIMAYCNNNANIADQNLVDQILANVKDYAAPTQEGNMIKQLFGNSDNVNGEYTYNFNNENILESITGALNIDCKYATVASSVLNLLKGSADIPSSIKDNLNLDGSKINASFTQANDLIPEDLKGKTMDGIWSYCQGLFSK